ncbi:unnamed protein product [Spirodela intermedia]|uniref:Uncharacterized protein n=1 Tax=Spirodela intermedia TaxID=51605 RepID=A0A7I8L5E4_SPIIN|nr:unnamed protein product [Spirodela intermedia]
MLLLDFALWIIPFTLIVAPLRRFTSLLAQFQQIHENMRSPRHGIPSFWSLLARSHL